MGHFSLFFRFKFFFCWQWTANHPSSIVLIKAYFLSALLYFPFILSLACTRWRKTRTRCAGSCRRLRATPPPNRGTSAPSSSSWTTSNTRAVAFCDTRRCLALVTSAPAVSAPRRWGVGRQNIALTVVKGWLACSYNHLQCRRTYWPFHDYG